MNVKNAVEEAEKRIRPYVRKTYLQYSPRFSEMSGANVYLKLENLQLTGSFKVRGATNKILALAPIARERGIVTSSSGNHGAAIAYNLQRFELNGVVFAPESASIAKINNIRQYGVSFHIGILCSYENPCLSRDFLLYSSTSILRALVFATLGIVTSKTPCLLFALICSPSTDSGRLKRRMNEPLERSARIKSFDLRSTVVSFSPLIVRILLSI